MFQDHGYGSEVPARWGLSAIPRRERHRRRQLPIVRNLSLSPEHLDNSVMDPVVSAALSRRRSPAGTAPAESVRASHTPPECGEHSTAGCRPPVQGDVEGGMNEGTQGDRGSYARFVVVSERRLLLYPEPSPPGVRQGGGLPIRGVVERVCTSGSGTCSVGRRQVLRMRRARPSTFRRSNAGAAGTAIRGCRRDASSAYDLHGPSAGTWCPSGA